MSSFSAFGQDQKVYSSVTLVQNVNEDAKSYYNDYVKPSVNFNGYCIEPPMTTLATDRKFDNLFELLDYIEGELKQFQQRGGNTCVDKNELIPDIVLKLITVEKVGNLSDGRQIKVSYQIIKTRDENNNIMPTSIIEDNFTTSPLKIFKSEEAIKKHIEDKFKSQLNKNSNFQSLCSVEKPEAEENPRAEDMLLDSLRVYLNVYDKYKGSNKKYAKVALTQASVFLEGLLRLAPNNKTYIEYKEQVYSILINLK